ncbi:LPS translocon maturation chaperone LptM [Ramlibacter sp. PS4R-6]|uniref:LPS translocon maturation chaperone LptM n=1 Tax=Ramlibacter sp. PS4R-6 TaxID=3133438 RepID=UPI0030B7D578
MTKFLRPILGIAFVLAALAGCGQKGPLYLPTGDAAAARATLPQTLNPTPPDSAVTNTGTGQANPAPRP